jgi:hypothetical protein
LVRTRFELRSETESWKIASFNRLVRRTIKIKLDKLIRSP